MNTLHVEMLTRDDLSQWDLLVTDSPHSTVFHSGKWITTCADLLAKNVVIYGYFSGDDLIGGCSVYSQSHFHLFSTAISTAPLSPYGGYLMAPFASSGVRKDEKLRNTIITEINKVMVKTFGYIKLVNSPALVDIRPFLWDGWNPSVHYLYYLDLRDHREDKLSKDVRRNVRKAQKKDISIEKESDVDLFYALLEKTYEKQNLPVPFTKTFHINMIEMIISNGLGEIWIARSPDGEPAAADIIIWDSRRAYRWSSALDPRFKDTGATSLLLFEIFEELQRRNFSEINLMAANTPHITNFISGFNPTLVPYYSIEKTTPVGALLGRLSWRR